MTTRARHQSAPVEDTDLDLAAQLRLQRRARGMTLRDVAGRAGVTESFLSQVERGVASPSVASLQRIARGLGLSIAELFAGPATAGRVVRRDERRHVTYAGLGAVDEFLTPPTATRLQVILSTIEPGGGTGDEPYTHESDEEVVLVLEGELDLWVADEHYHLQEGDTVTHSSRLPHRNRNGGSKPARVLFSITPPSF
ncbi:MAG TPA: XRE family transcriptional regulator [Candidatus Limnocylindrales bacterium]|nr:XRE family transcriptional regulator [Candidatus Limnocylindrales bacterium]